MSLKAKLEAIIYATEEPVTLNELASLLKDQVMAELRAEEEARLALNETVFEPPVRTPEQDEESLFIGDVPSGVEEAAAEAEVKRQDDTPAPSGKERQTEEKEHRKAINAYLSRVLDELIADYASPDRGMEIRQIAGGYRMATKPEHHDVVVSFAKSLKPPVRLSLQALETLAVIAYKQPVTVPEISEIRGVDSAGVIATLLDRKLITTAGRKQVIGRPILYKTTKEFLLRFGLKDVNELPSVEEFEKLGDPQSELFNPPGEKSAASDEEPVTEAVPATGQPAGKSIVPEEGSFATEAEPGQAESKSESNAR